MAYEPTSSANPALQGRNAAFAPQSFNPGQRFPGMLAGQVPPQGLILPGSGGPVPGQGGAPVPGQSGAPPPSTGAPPGPPGAFGTGTPAQPGMPSGMSPGVMEQLQMPADNNAQAGLGMPGSGPIAGAMAGGGPAMGAFGRTGQAPGGMGPGRSPSGFGTGAIFGRGGR